MSSPSRARRAWWRSQLRAPESVEAAARWLRHGIFPLRPARAPRIGVEYELLALESGALLPARWEEGRGVLGRWLHAHARAQRWHAEAAGKGAPKWRLPGGGSLTLEPGGQVEYASPAFAGVEPLIANLEATVARLRESAAGFDIELCARGVDPHNALDAAPLQLTSPRYARMAAYFAAIGPAGACMMRQTASVQINIDARFAPDVTWRTANALVPYLVALFANSPVYARAPSGAASFRARLWRELDPARTGVRGGSGDPARAYAEFALDAPAMLLDGMRFGARRRSLAEWTEHLTTLFPEVRPRGYLEIRSIDSVEVERAARALRMVAGLLWHPEAFAGAAQVLPAPEAALLERAGEKGLKDETLRLRAERLLDLGETAAAELSGATCAAPVPLPR